MSENTVFTEEEAGELAHTQSLRRQLLSQLTQQGVPQQPSDKVLLLGLVDGMDRSSLARAKLRHDKAKDENMKSAISMVGELLLTINTRTHRPVAGPADRQIPAELRRDFVPGEVDIGIEPLTAEQVIQS